MSQSNSVEGPASYTYPIGHINHLTADQSEALVEFKGICKQSGYYHSSDDGINASHDDGTLLRFLRARKFVPKDAFEQFRAAEEWRKEQDLDNWYDTIQIDDYEETRLQYTQWTGRRDKRGIPLYVFQIGDLDAKKLSEHDSAAGKPRAETHNSKLRRLFATYEGLTNFVLPLCSAMPSQPYPETPVSQTCNIVDISGVGLRQFWSLKAHLQDASALATAYYPETLGRTFIVGAPSFFPTIWNWIKNWFDPVTVAKVFVLAPHEVTPTLERYINVEDIPKRYGGTLDWDFGDRPSLDSEILEVMKLEKEATGIPIGPIRWKKSGDGSKVEAHALGTELGKQRDDIIGHVDIDVFSQSRFPLNSEQHQRSTTLGQTDETRTITRKSGLTNGMNCLNYNYNQRNQPLGVVA